MIIAFVLIQKIFATNQVELSSNPCAVIGSLACHASLMRSFDGYFRKTQRAAKHVEEALADFNTSAVLITDVATSHAEAGAFLNSHHIVQVASDAIAELTEAYINAIDELHHRLELFHEGTIDATDHYLFPLSAYAGQIQGQLNSVLYQAALNLNVLVNRVNWRLRKLQTVAHNSTQLMAKNLQYTQNEFARNRYFEDTVFDDFKNSIAESVTSLGSTYIPSDLYEALGAFLDPVLDEIASAGRASEKLSRARFERLIDTRLRSPVLVKLGIHRADTNASLHASMQAHAHVLKNASIHVVEPVEKLKRQLDSYETSWDAERRASHTKRSHELVLVRATDLETKLRSYLSEAESQRLQHELSSKSLAVDLESLRRSLRGRVQKSLSGVNVSFVSLPSFQRDSTDIRFQESLFGGLATQEEFFVNNLEELQTKVKSTSARVSTRLDSRLRKLNNLIKSFTDTSLEDLSRASDSFVAASVDSEMNSRRFDQASSRDSADALSSMRLSTDSAKTALKNMTKSFSREAIRVEKAILDQRKRVVARIAHLDDEAERLADSFERKSSVSRAGAGPSTMAHIPDMLKDIERRLLEATDRMKKGSVVSLVDPEAHHTEELHKLKSNWKTTMSLLKEKMTRSDTALNSVMAQAATEQAEARLQLDRGVRLLELETSKAAAVVDSSLSKAEVEFNRTFEDARGRIDERLRRKFYSRQDESTAVSRRVNKELDEMISSLSSRIVNQAIPGVDDEINGLGLKLTNLNEEIASYGHEAVRKLEEMKRRIPKLFPLSFSTKSFEGVHLLESNVSSEIETVSRDLDAVTEATRDRFAADLDRVLGHHTKSDEELTRLLAFVGESTSRISASPGFYRLLRQGIIRLDSVVSGGKRSLTDRQESQSNAVVDLIHRLRKVLDRARSRSNSRALDAGALEANGLFAAAQEAAMAARRATQQALINAELFRAGAGSVVAEAFGHDKLEVSSLVRDLSVGLTQMNKLLNERNISRDTNATTRALELIQAMKVGMHGVFEAAANDVFVGNASVGVVGLADADAAGRVTEAFAKIYENWQARKARLTAGSEVELAVMTTAVEALGAAQQAEAEVLVSKGSDVVAQLEEKASEGEVVRAKLTSENQGIEEGGRGAVSSARELVESTTKVLDDLVAETERSVEEANERRAATMKEFVREMRTRVWAMGEAASK